MTEELGAIYRKIAEKKARQYEFLFSLESVMLSVMEFDPVTDEPLPVTVDDVLHKMASSDVLPDNWQNDRMNHIVRFVSSAVRTLIDILHEKNLREHCITRPEQVREVDSKSMMWLAKKPGFTVKQKIASEQKMMGVYHTTSLDTAENRLFKAFMRKLDELLLEKENACKKCGLKISDDDERFTSTVHRWLKSNEADCIGRWNNTPPNNTLLNDKNYRKIWKAHLMLQNLDEQIHDDLNDIEKIKNQTLFWLTVSKLNLSNDIRFRQTLLFPDYKNLSLMQNADLIGFAKTNSWEKIKVSAKSDALVLTFGQQETESSLPEDVDNIFDIIDCAEQICNDAFPEKKFELSYTEIKNSHSELVLQKNVVAAVDLNSIFPPFTLGDKTKGRLAKKLLHQSLCFSKNEQHIRYPCSSYQSKLIYTKERGLKTFSIHSIFDDKLRSKIDSDDDRIEVEKACSDFAKTVKNELRCQKCLYITNDDLDDFSPTVNAFKYSMNSAFSKTEILPKSIATLFSRFSEIQNSFGASDEIFVRTVFDDYEIKTKIRIKIDEKLLKQNPETKGICFQRLSSERIELSNDCSTDLVPKNLRRILTLQDANLLQGVFSADAFHFEERRSLKKIQAGKKEIMVFADDDTSIGAIEYERLQNISPDIPLWYDFLPKLSMVDSSGEEYILVEPEKVHIRPLVGKPVRIPIDKHFSFPAQKAFYEFPLVQGEKKEKSKYFAFIKDSSFPLENETECTLYLTYTYGMPLPYNLEFLPVSNVGEFKSVVVKWENKSHKDYIHDMPVPNFVKEYTWEDMKAFPGRKRAGKSQNSDLINEWLPTEFKKIKKLANGKIKICKPDSVELVKEFTEEKKYKIGIKLPNGEVTLQYFTSKQKVNKNSFFACEFGGTDDIEKIIKNKTKLTSTFLKSLRFPALTVWNNERSICDADCPEEFRECVQDVLNSLEEKPFKSSVPKEIQHEQKFLLSCMHKDMPKWFSRYISKEILPKVENDYDYPNWIAYSLGDCSMEWQKDLLSKTISLLNKPSKSVYVIRILAKAFWRVNSFVFNLKTDDVEKILSVIESALYSDEKRNSMEQTAIFSACLECLVALCRLRKTEDGEFPEDKMLKLLSPFENENVKQIIKKLKKLKKSNVKIKTFLTFEINRPADDQTPELLYATYGYLSGEIDSNAIKVLEADFGEQ